MMLKSFPFSATDFQIYWGSPIPKGSRSGVAFLVRKGSFWNVRPISFENSVCHKYYEEGRLHAVQLFFQAGGRSVILYALYGYAGARWEHARKDTAETMYRDIAQDIAARGSIPAYIAGNFNLQVTESRLLQEIVKV